MKLLIKKNLVWGIRQMQLGTSAETLLGKSNNESG